MKKTALRIKNKKQTVKKPHMVSFLKVFPNPETQRDYEIEINCPEFTSVCPKTGQPDFGEIIITYSPHKTCIELKSLKYYLQQYRSKGIYYEDATNRILDDLVKACAPRWMEVMSQWHPRGGITTSVVVRYTGMKQKK
jgi:7-cyano-7-deazaguanine reductase